MTTLETSNGRITYYSQPSRSEMAQTIGWLYTRFVLMTDETQYSDEITRELERIKARFIDRRMTTV